jgi:hypothetical protein
VTKKIIALIAAGVIVVLASMALDAWHSATEAQRHLQSALMTQQKLIADTSARESTRNDSLQNTLNQITKLKKSTRTSSQILSELPKYLPLPQPITFGARTIPSDSERTRITLRLAAKPETSVNDSENSLSDSSGRATESAKTVAQALTSTAAPTTNKTPAIQLPTKDLKPLFDFTQDCRACQAELTVAQQDAADDSAKLTAVMRERDLAVKAARGGSFLRRLRRNLGWLAAGAVGGYVAGHL